MKKNVKIEKQFEFPTMIGEICAISLEQHLLFVEKDLVRGDLDITGRYKATIASQIEKDFQFSIPVEITILEDIDSSTANIDIIDFYYNLIDSRMLSCVIEIQVEAVDLLEEKRECDGDSVDLKEEEIPVLETMEEEAIHHEIVDENTIENDEILRDDQPLVEDINHDINSNNKIDDSSGLFNIDLSSESYGTFIVYMVRQNETINSILEKYHTSLEEIEKYNDLKNISMGSKLIIPLIKDENS